ncbi:MAG: DUF4388 domain-containing protein [Chloroflexi bacterium]|nr:DUF4388 domain-containing protein [Chloroflexota bacterium]
MQGDLKHFGGTQLLSLISLAKKTGTLDVDRSGGAASLAFKEGKLIFAAIGGIDGSLAAVLASAGRISQDQASALSKRAQQTGDKQLGLLMIQKGYISQADIIKSIKRHAILAITQFAGWDSGKFKFEPTKLPGGDRITVPVDMENVIIKISREKKRDEELEREIPSLDVYLRHGDNAKIDPKELQLNKDEWQVLRYVGPKNTIRMIAKSCNMNDRQIRRVVGSLREAGLVELDFKVRGPKLTTEQKKEKKALVNRIIGRLQTIGED